MLSKCHHEPNIEEGTDEEEDDDGKAENMRKHLRDEHHQTSGTELVN